MAFPTVAAADPSALNRAHLAAEPGGPAGASSAVSWGAILAGAAAAAALSLILLILGTGLGLSSLSPFAQAGVSATAFGISTIVWITVTQIMASGMGGYLAGRLRSKWVAVHTDEVYFRDTAHGFLAWAIASLATAALLGSVVASVVGSGIQAGAAVAGGVASAVGAGGAAMANSNAGNANAGNANSPDSGNGPLSYFVDTLFRKEVATAPAAAASGVATSGNGNTDASNAATSSEVTRILLNSIRAGALPADDARYLGQLVAQRTGLPPADAEKRVNDTFQRIQTKLQEAATAAKEAANTARKASVTAALWLFISLLIGAFVASLSATFGGRQRDA